MEKRERLLYIDIAKGMGMLSVMWGHVMLGGGTNAFVYTFHIPMFFFLSGMMFDPSRYDGFGHFLRRRVKGLLLPYAVFSVVTWAYWAVRNVLLNTPPKSWFAPLFQTVLAQGSARYMIHNVALWFVTCLFVTEVLYYFAAKVPIPLRLLLLAVSGFVGWLMVQPGHSVDFTKLYWNVEVAFTALVFYGAGSLFAQLIFAGNLRERIGRKRLLWGALAVLLWIGIYFGAKGNGHVSLAQGYLGNSTPVFYVLAFCGVAATLITAVILESFSWPGSRYLRWLGQNSFYAMAIHVPVMVDLVYIGSVITGLPRDDLRYSFRFTVPIFLGMILVTSVWIWVILAVKRRKNK